MQIRDRDRLVIRGTQEEYLCRIKVIVMCLETGGWTMMWVDGGELEYVM